jgi:hypothetical protein
MMAMIAQPPRHSWRRMLVITSLAILVLAGQVRAQSSSTTIVHNGQIQECGATMFEVDVDNDGKVNRAEYINLLMDISPYKTPASFGVFPRTFCPDSGNIEDFLGDSPLSAVFEEYACRCLEHEEEGKDCCKAQQDKHLKVPGVYSRDYTFEMCTAIVQTIESECTTAAPAVSAAPSLTPTPAPSRAPSVSPAPSAVLSIAPSSSAAPSSLPTLVPTSNIIQAPELTKGGEDEISNFDYDDIIKIIVPALLGAVVLAFVVGLLLVHRKQQSKKSMNRSKPAFNTLGQDDMADDNDDMLLFSYDDNALAPTERDLSASESDSHLVFTEQLLKNSGKDGDEEQGLSSYPGATARTDRLSGESEPSPFDNRHHELDLVLNLSDDNSESGHIYRSQSVGSLTWSGGGDDDSHDSSYDGNNPVDSLLQNLEKSYTSPDEKGGGLDSREVAINAIIEQTRAGAEWFEFDLPSSDSDDSDDDDDDDDDHNHGHDHAHAYDEISNGGSYRLEEGLDPEDAKALDILLKNNVSLR